MAETQGFEPWEPVNAQRFSRPPRSTTPARLRIAASFTHQGWGVQDQIGAKMTKPLELLGNSAKAT